MLWRIRSVALFAAVAVMLMCRSFVAAQTPHPLSYFPHRAGNLWQYRSQFTGEIVATLRLVKDSVGANGSKYLWIATGHFPLVREIDTLYNVWEVSGTPLGRGNRPYRLDADSGASWRVNLQPPPYDSARVIRVFQSRVFGQAVTVKKIVYWQRGRLGDSLWYSTHYLASGFGLVQQDIEPSDIYYLAGAIIDSVRWGFIVGVPGEKGIPATSALDRNYPNPFNPATTLSYALPGDSVVSLRVFDLLGREVATLVSQNQKAGRYDVQFDAANLPSGIYLYKIQAGGFTDVKRMILLK